MNRLATAVAALAALTLAPGLLTASVAAEPGAPQERRTAIRLDDLERGPDAAVPYRRHRTIQDGDLRRRIPGRQPDLLGEVDGGYLVTSSVDGRTTLRVLARRGGDRVLGTFGSRSRSFTLSDDARVVLMRLGGRARSTRFMLLSSTDGRDLARLRSPRSLWPLDVTADEVVLTSDDPRQVLSWSPGSGDVRIVVRESGGLADLDQDVLVRTPRRRGTQCLEMASLSSPREAMWSRCADEVPRLLSPDGQHLLVSERSWDAQDLRVLDAAGEQVARYRIRDGWGTGLVHFEDEQTVLLGVESGDAGAVVRCSGTHCELASGVAPHPPR
ncbi:hypothetical protein I601_2600 [Nocardioides dokdonensis FR1436]|uniref:Translocation protein TolB n=1 Tax=Nocardioides dokdonensis FR1436 TaxID=1300347 RepID=A0A1A9GLP6_9ACTN|nr:hypothetical protein I601_2600 [Nocardioides dokdonensis FR1436]